MKKHVCLMVLCLLLVGILLPAQAAAADNWAYVTDLAGILSDSEAATLENQAAQVSEARECDVYILTVEDYTDYYNGSIYEFAKAVYRDYDLGWGSGKDGELLVLSMADRDYALIAYGDFGNYAFTDYGNSQLVNGFLDNFRNNDWYGGFSDYISMSDDFLQQARNGSPVDVSGSGKNGPGIGAFIIILLIACLIAGIVCLSMKNKLKSAVTKTDAVAYIAQNGVLLTAQEDRFTHTTTERVALNDDSDRGHGGGTTVDSDGFSGSSGKF